MSMKLVIVNETKCQISDKQMQKAADKVIHCLSYMQLQNRHLLKSQELTCVFLSAQKMRTINKKFRGKDKPTDVLSFHQAADEPPDQPPPDESADGTGVEASISLGELLFCPTVLKKQAHEQGHSLSREWLYMFIHGILHLLGYDHEKSAQDEKLMFKLQDRVFEKVTVDRILF